MKSIALLMLFVGVVLIIKSYYEFKYSNIDKPKTIIKYIPISQYEETLTDSEKLSEFYKGMFELSQPNMYDAKKI
jgi:hypothetical protein